MALNQSLYEVGAQCRDWCVNQLVAGYNNIELTYILFVVLALLLIIAYEFCNEHERLKKYAPDMVYFAKIALYIFFFAYFVILRGRMYFYVS